MKWYISYIADRMVHLSKAWQNGRWWSVKLTKQYYFKGLPPVLSFKLTREPTVWHHQPLQPHRPFPVIRLVGSLAYTFTNIKCLVRTLTWKASLVRSLKRCLHWHFWLGSSHHKSGGEWALKWKHFLHNSNRGSTCLGYLGQWSTNRNNHYCTGSPRWPRQVQKCLCILQLHKKADLHARSKLLAKTILISFLIFI
jgi:hypothetical protein